MNCIKCNAELPPAPVATGAFYNNWCDHCFATLPLSERYPKCTPADLAEMRDRQAKTEAALKAKKAKKQATQAETVANNGKSKKGKKQAVNDDSNGGGDSLFDYQDKD